MIVFPYISAEIRQIAMNVLQSGMITPTMTYLAANLLEYCELTVLKSYKSFEEW